MEMSVNLQSRSGVPPLVSNPESGGTPLLLVDSKEGVPLAVARKAFGNDPKPIIEELNEVLVA